MTHITSIIACHDCDLLQKNPPPSALCLPSLGSHTVTSARWTTAVVIECPRCGAILRRTQKNSLDRTIAWLIAGLILYFVAVSFPFLALQSHGIANETALISGIIILYKHKMASMAAVVLATCLILPLYTMISLLYILLSIKLNRYLPGVSRLFAWTLRLRPWGMMEVYLLAILISMVKLTKLARIIPGPALYSFIALTFVLAAASISLDNHVAWDFFKPRQVLTSAKGKP
ncbi:MAG: paraquat-inducible protein A [Desulfobulbaceae bacterium]|nr:paraquat-inducible protein A [Desulfobulbaceae bacterium]